MHAASHSIRILIAATTILVGIPLNSARAELDPDTHKAVGKAVVQISSRIVRTENGKKVETPPIPLGSGTIISNDGYVLTNYHVLDQGDVIATVADDQERLRRQGQDVTLEVQRGFYLISTSENDEPPTLRFVANRVADDPSLDLAILKITKTKSGRPLKDPDPFPFVDLGDSNEVQTGDPVHVFGYPSTTSSLAYTEGNVSSFEVDQASGDGLLWLVSDVTVGDGSSGGAAVNEAARLVGVPTAVEQPSCVPWDSNGDGVVDEADVGCVPSGSPLVKLRPINMAKPMLESTVDRTPTSTPTKDPTKEPTKVIGGNPYDGERYASNLGDPADPGADPYHAQWDGWRLWQPDLPPENERRGFTVSFNIAANDFLYNGVACTLFLADEQVASHQNGAVFSIPTNTTGRVDCDDASNSGFEIKLIEHAIRIHIGRNYWLGEQLPLPREPAGLNQEYLAHGDVLGNSTCAVMIWETGETVDGLSAADWHLWLIVGGTEDERQQHVTQLQDDAARTTGTCPIVSS